LRAIDAFDTDVFARAQSVSDLKRYRMPTEVKARLSAKAGARL
jgi:hypothetical protein